MYQFPTCIIDNLRNCDAGHKKYKPQYLDTAKLARIKRVPIGKGDRGDGGGGWKGGSPKKSILKKGGGGGMGGLGKRKCFTEVGLGVSGVSLGVSS